MFNVEVEVNNIVNFIRDYYQKNNLKGVIIGISGGKDSAVVAALFTKALGSENVIGVKLPCHSKEIDSKDAQLISDYYNFKLINLDLTNVYDTFEDEINKIDNFKEEDKINSQINIKPRLRMMSLYYLAALYSSIYNKPYLVAGTSNKSEIFVGYFTKGGDNVCDIRVISDLTKEEVIKVGEYLKVPEKVLYKAPSDGLTNKTDEDKLGVKYSDIALYMDNKLVDKEITNKIETLHKNNLHKFNIPTYEKSNK